jgi:hypothetical protein
MVITNIIGGLGNQMFQYAVARSLSIKLNSPLLLDISGFENYGLHQGFELQRIFNCTSVPVSKAEINKILGWQAPAFIRRVVSRPSLTALRSKSFVLEPHFNYWAGISHLTGNCYLSGYWQTEKYFSEVAHEIRADFAFKLAMNTKNTELAQQINQVNAVSLHVRRGDYANNAKNIATHGLCSLDYYQSAIKHITKQVKQPHFFVFSDDIAWVETNLKIDSPHHFVGHNHGAESYNDMRLMSLCKHNIIANSSFSWWGAWLNSNVKKNVIAPKHWFANETNVEDLIPQSWVRI